MCRAWRGQSSSSRPATVSGEGDAIRRGRGGVGGGKYVDYYEMATFPSSSDTSTAVPPSAEAHLERLVTRLIKSSWARR